MSNENAAAAMNKLVEEMNKREFNRGYEKGMEDAWEMLRKIYYFENLSNDELKQIFGKDWSITNIFTNYSAKEAKEKIENYNKKMFYIGDELVEIGTNNKYIFICNYDTLVRVIDKSGTSWLTSQSKFKKTGRHFEEVKTLLKKLREDNNESNKE